jgi:hypothetical protein
MSITSLQVEALAAKNIAVKLSQLQDEVLTQGR